MNSKTVVTLAVLAFVAVLGLPGTGLAGETGSWTGEVVDSACYIAKGARGEAHAGCAKGCVKGGQPMGLVTADGTHFILAADHKDKKAFEDLKDLAGQTAEVTGSVSKKDGIKLLTVTGFKAAK